MSFELDSVFHTETMVKILYAQGQVYYATALCETLTAKYPDKQDFHLLLEGIRKGQIPEKVPAYQAKVVEASSELFEDEITEPGITFEALEMKEEQAVEASSEELLKRNKLEVLNQLLQKIQVRKNEIH